VARAKKCRAWATFSQHEEAMMEVPAVEVQRRMDKLAASEAAKQHQDIYNQAWTLTRNHFEAKARKRNSNDGDLSDNANDSLNQAKDFWHCLPVLDLLPEVEASATDSTFP